MSRQITIEEVYKIIDQVENGSIRNLLRIAYGQLRAEYEFDRGWKEANLPDLIRLDKRVKQLEAALEKAAIMAQEKWHSWPAEEISAAIRELKNERKLHKSPPDVFTT